MITENTFFLGNAPLEQGAPDRPEASIEAEGCLDYSYSPSARRARKRDLAMFNLAIDSKVRVPSRPAQDR